MDISQGRAVSVFKAKSNGRLDMYAVLLVILTQQFCRWKKRKKKSHGSKCDVLSRTCYTRIHSPASIGGGRIYCVRSTICFAALSKRVWYMCLVCTQRRRQVERGLVPLLHLLNICTLLRITGINERKSGYRSSPTFPAERVGLTRYTLVGPLIG